MSEEQPNADHTLLQQTVNYTVGICRVDTLDKSYDSIDWFEYVLPSVVMFEVIESMEMHFKTGKCLIYDPSKIRKQIPITGNEVITIKYRNALHGSDTPPKIVHFRIFNVQETQDDLKPNYPHLSYLMLNLIEFPAFEMFAIPHIYKTWDWEDDGENTQGVVISDAVKELLEDSVHNFKNWWDLEVDDTTSEDEDKVLFYSPNWTVMQSINYLSQFAQKQGKKYPNYYFKTVQPDEEGKKPKIHFKSIYSSMEGGARPYQTQEPEQMYRNTVTGEEGPQKPEPEDGDTFDPVDTILQYSFDWGNSNQLYANISGETLINWDAKESVHYLAYDFEKFINEYKGLGFYSTWMDKPGRDKKGVQWNRFYACPWKKKKQAQNFMRNSMFRKYFNNSIKVATKCHVNALRKCGENSRLFFTNYENEERIDLMFSGNWICWEIRDIIHGSGNAASEITFLKDSFFVEPENPSNYVKKIDSFDDGQGAG